MDTANKRMSALGVGAPYLQCFAVPDGTVGTGDKQSLALCYAGIEALVPAPPSAMQRSSAGHRRRRG